MSSSNFKVVRRWSTPTVPNWGIHDLFLHSDQKHYQHKCANCGYWNKMKYADYDPDNLENSGNIKMINPDGYHELAREVEDGTFDFVCQKCGKHLDRWFNGKWIADNPESKATSGYMISQMNAVWINY